MRHLPRYKEQKAALSNQRVCIARDNLRNNPHIIAYYFYQRLQVFTDKVLKDKFNIINYQKRFEWQARGSSYSHSLYQSNSVPNVSELGFSNAARKLFAKFQGIHVTAFNPKLDSSARPVAKNLSIQLPSTKLLNNSVTLFSTVN